MSIIEINKETKALMIDEIRLFFLKQRSESISDFHANLLLDYMLDVIGPLIYNQAINDAHRFISEKTEDLFGLEKRAR